jgi:hypothetical protein
MIALYTRRRGDEVYHTLVHSKNNDGTSPVALIIDSKVLNLSELAKHILSH